MTALGQAWPICQISKKKYFSLFPGESKISKFQNFKKISKKNIFLIYQEQHIFCKNQKDQKIRKNTGQWIFAYSVNY